MSIGNWKGDSPAACLPQPFETSTCRIAASTPPLGLWTEPRLCHDAGGSYSRSKIALALQRLQLLRPDEVGFFSWALQDSSKEDIGLVMGRKSEEILLLVVYLVCVVAGSNVWLVFV